MLIISLNQCTTLVLAFGVKDFIDYAISRSPVNKVQVAIQGIFTWPIMKVGTMAFIFGDIAVSNCCIVYTNTK